MEASGVIRILCGNKVILVPILDCDVIGHGSALRPISTAPESTVRYRRYCHIIVSCYGYMETPRPEICSSYKDRVTFNDLLSMVFGGS